MADPEQRRLYALTRFEKEARCQGYQLIGGIDEAGRGPLAGPVVAAACLIPQRVYFRGINDSKQLTPEQRESLFQEITSHPKIVYGVGIVSPAEIDRFNIYQATIMAMMQAVEGLAVKPDYLLVDGLNLPHPHIPCQKIIKGDAKSQSIAAASVLAKVTRDRIMCEIDAQWPQYGFKQHKGYGTPQHLAALQEFGPCPIHRKSFAPIRVEQEQLYLF